KEHVSAIIAQSRVLLSRAFFFQAEDGIRDRNVTGVQTCALPISSSGTKLVLVVFIKKANSTTEATRSVHTIHLRLIKNNTPFLRSEERRVGKECRSSWSAHHCKKQCKTKRR